MDVIGIGIPNIDLLAHIDELPKENASASLLQYSWQGGGKVATALVALARLGADVGIIGVVGDCLYGNFCAQDFKKHNIDVSRLIIDKNKNTSLAIVLSDNKTCGRNIIFKSGNVRSLTEKDIDEKFITSAKYLHLAEVTPVTKKAANLAKEHGVKVVFDADSYNKDIETMLPLIDVFIASEFYYLEVFHNENYEENCKNLLKKGPSIVVFTFGDKGCIAMDKTGFYNIPSFKVPVVDTTGAGDVFHGAFIFGLLQNWDTLNTARFSNAVAAIKCTRIGGRAAIPALSTVIKFIDSGEIDFKEIDERVKYYENGISLAMD